jgi:hypothetical protein
MRHSSSHGLWGISLSFPRLFPTLGHVHHVLLSGLPRAEPSRLAWLKRTPIAVVSGRINQNWRSEASFTIHPCAARWAGTCPLLLSKLFR